MRQPPAPSALDHVVERCLEKDADERWQDAGDVKRELAWIAEGGTAVAPVGARARNPWLERAAWITAVSIAVRPIVVWSRNASANASTQRFENNRAEVSDQPTRQREQQREPRSKDGHATILVNLTVPINGEPFARLPLLN
jgi:hypothetical protein